jgi:hypothetical protein
MPILWKSRSGEGRPNLDFASLNLVWDKTANTGPKTNADLLAECAPALTISRTWFKMTLSCQGVLSAVSVAGSVNAVARHVQFAHLWSVFLVCHALIPRVSRRRTTYNVVLSSNWARRC